MKLSLNLKVLVLINLILVFLSIFILVLILNSIFISEDFFEKRTISVIELFIIVLMVILIILSSTSIVLSLKEYKNKLEYRFNVRTGASNLTLNNIFDNENRQKIIRNILQNPGIHHNELLRKCDLQKGLLQWHIDVLLKNKVIKKEIYNQYTVYFPITKNIDEFGLFSNGLAKAETTNKIYDIIKAHPGICASKIAREINLARNSVKYHIDKLLNEDLIQQKRKGRKKLLFASL